MEQNIIDIHDKMGNIQKDVGNLSGKIDQFVGGYPTPSKLEKTDNRSKWNRKLIAFILTILLGGGSATGIGYGDKILDFFGK